jgi:hypothetical protein
MHITWDCEWSTANDPGNSLSPVTLHWAISQGISLQPLNDLGQQLEIHEALFDAEP